METDKEADPLAVLRGDLLRDLPGDIKRVRNAYRRAAQQAAVIREAKDFTAHQAACKAGLSHLDSLIKLLRWACEGAVEAARDDTNNCQISAIDRLIDEARRQLSE